MTRDAPTEGPVPLADLLEAAASANPRARIQWRDRIAAPQVAQLHIWRTWPAEEAIAAGPSFATEALLPVLGDLFDLYLDVVLATLHRR